MRILVCGSRNWRDREAIAEELRYFPSETVVVHGDNGYDAHDQPLWGQPDSLAVRGADKLAGAVAVTLGFTVLVFTPEWEQHGRRAGPLRNSRMLREGKPDLVLACATDLDKSVGTRDLIRQAERVGIPVKRLTGGEG